MVIDSSVFVCPQPHMTRAATVAVPIEVFDLEQRAWHALPRLVFLLPRHRRLCIAAGATSLTLLAFVVAGVSSNPSALLLAVLGFVPPIIMPMWTGAPAYATPARQRLRHGYDPER